MDLYVSVFVRMYSILNITISYRVHTLQIQSVASKNKGFRGSEYTDTRTNNRQEFEAVRSLLVENMVYYLSYTRPRHRRIIQTTVAMEYGCHLQLGMSQFSLFRDRLFVGLYRGIIPAFRTGEFISDSRPYIISQSSMAWYYCV